VAHAEAGHHVAGRQGHAQPGAGGQPTALERDDVDGQADVAEAVDGGAVLAQVIGGQGGADPEPAVAPADGDGEPGVVAGVELLVEPTGDGGEADLERPRRGRGGGRRGAVVMMVIVLGVGRGGDHQGDHDDEQPGHGDRERRREQARSARARRRV
jgi:hypothetical protein